MVNVLTTIQLVLSNWNVAKPIYEELPGWSEDITGVRNLENLPENARNYVRREWIGWRSYFTFSVGPGRERKQIFRKCLVLRDFNICLR